MESGDEYMSSMATKMWEKFQKYWAEFSDTLAIASIFDPRYKLEFLEFIYNKLYGSDSVDKLRGKINSLYSNYSTTFDGGMTSLSKDQEPNPKKAKTLYEGFDVNCSLFKEFDNAFVENSNSLKSQLDLYLEEPRMSRQDNVDVLAFWKSNKNRYPIVVVMARDILAIPVSTVASEAAFSVGGRVLDQFRSSLKPETVEAIICTRDWLFGDKGDPKFDEDIDKLTQNVVILETKDKDICVVDNSLEEGIDSHAG